ncbi:MAG: riboflavin biosynthesis protein RibF [Propionibacteriaceae bacterium]|jgi:riboflavin kinase/FMN adenylyltransferase|nr:riboflavin biosynthesis protein RibF [Propionibacteriaceae bacterium]
MNDTSTVQAAKGGLVTTARRAIAIGNFDGVHRGHRAIIDAARGMAGEDGTVIAVTFWPHPIAVLHADKAPALLTGITDRIRLLHDAGADDVSIVEFTSEVSAWDALTFIERVITPLSPDAIVVGENFRFARGAGADGRDLAELSGVPVQVLSMLMDDGPVSSSRVRDAVTDGDIALATRLLGRPFRYSGLVILGDQRGRTLGFPTANMSVPSTFACPADGVYAGWLNQGDDQRWPAAISVGTNPTFSGVQRRVESYAINETDLKLYGVRVGVDFVARLRGQLTFASKEDLIAQMTRDVERALAILDERA